MNWRFTERELPEKSCEVVAICGDRSKPRYSYLISVSYSARFKKFNVSDHLDMNKPEDVEHLNRCAFEDVIAWVPESELLEDAFPELTGDSDE